MKTTTCSVAFVVLFMVGSTSVGEVVHWAGLAAVHDWGIAENWYGVLPGSTDTAYFDNVGASTIPDEVTNFLVSDHTVGGLTYDNNGLYHTTDMGSATLTVEGDLNFNVNQPGHTTTILRNGHLHVAAPLGYVTVGHSHSGGAWTNVSLGALAEFTAEIYEFHVGTRISGSAFGKLTLAETNVVEAGRIFIGDGGTGELHLGQTNTILADELLIGGSYGSAVVNIASGGTLHLGSADRRTSLFVGKGITNTNSTYAGTLDLSLATVYAYLDHLTVGQKDSNPGIQQGTFLGGDGGSISVGQPGNTANMIVGDRATGVADFSSMDTFTANLDQMIIGRNKSGTVKLAATSTIDARTIVVGQGAGATLALGLDNTILVDQFEIGKSYSNGVVDIRSGGTLRLGSPDRRTDLTIGKGTTNTNSTYTGTLDLTNATLVAYLGHVMVGEKDNMPGGQRGTFTLSDHEDNYLDADSILLGGTRATGTLNFAGGRLLAGSIERGPGTAEFNWTGGTLHVDTFGAPERPFDLLNNDRGTLAPGTSIGSTEIFGDYRQGFAATLEVELGSAVSFDQLIVHEGVTLAGTLFVKLLPGAAAGEFPIVQYGSLSDEFDEILVPGLSPDEFSIDYGARTDDVITITLTGVPEPSALVLLCAGAVGLLVYAWRRRKGK